MDLAIHPVDRLVRRWNWKSALLSALCRGSIFFAVNLAAGWRSAAAAFVAELLLRGVMSGFYGAMTAAFAEARPVWAATLTTMAFLPLLSHLLEFALHHVRGTPELFKSIVASAAFTVLSTAFNLFAMRHGALVVGPGRAPLADDLRRMPRLIADFAVAAVRVVGRLRRTRGVS